MITENNLIHANISSVLLKKLDNYFSKQNIEVKKNIFIEKRNQYFKLKNLNPSIEISVLELESFYSAINYFYNLHQKATSKNKSMSTSELKKYNEYTIKASKKQNRIALKEEFLLDKSSIVNNLLFEKSSYREISNYFNKYHNKSISHTYIKKIIEKYPAIFNTNEGSDNATN